MGLADLLADVPRFDEQGGRVVVGHLTAGLLVGRGGAKGGVQREIGRGALRNTGTDVAAR